MKLALHSHQSSNPATHPSWILQWEDSFKTMQRLLHNVWDSSKTSNYFKRLPHNSLRITSRVLSRQEYSKPFFWMHQDQSRIIPRQLWDYTTKVSLIDNDFKTTFGITSYLLSLALLSLAVLSSNFFWLFLICIKLCFYHSILSNMTIPNTTPY